jgi:hypothetical protein
MGENWTKRPDFETGQTQPNKASWVEPLIIQVGFFQPVEPSSGPEMVQPHGASEFVSWSREAGTEVVNLSLAVYLIICRDYPHKLCSGTKPVLYTTKYFGRAKG